jgi:hypothetical protein
LTTPAFFNVFGQVLALVLIGAAIGALYGATRRAFGGQANSFNANVLTTLGWMAVAMFAAVSMPLGERIWWRTVVGVTLAAIVAAMVTKAGWVKGVLGKLAVQAVYITALAVGIFGTSILGALLVTQLVSVLQGRLDLRVGESIGAALGGAVGAIIAARFNARRGGKRMATVEPQQWLGSLLLLALANGGVAWLVFR